MVSTHLRKKDDPNKSYLYAYTEMLAMQDDMIPCDAKGNPVGVAGEVLGGGMRARESEAPNKELEIALEAITALKAEVEALKVIPEKIEQPAASEKVEITENLDEKTRDNLLAYLKEKHGKKADHLKGNLSKQTLLEEAEKLQAVADLSSK